MAGVGGVVGALVVAGDLAFAAGLAPAGHPAGADPAADDAPQRVRLGSGRVAGDAGVVAAGAVLGADGLGGVPLGAGDEGGVGGLG